MELFLFNLNKDESGAQEVHTSKCANLPASQSQAFLGPFENSAVAMEAAKQTYPTMNFAACEHCCQ